VRVEILLLTLAVSCSATVHAPTTPERDAQDVPDADATLADAGLDHGLLDANITATFDAGDVQTDAGAQATFRIATLNLQNFGPTKAARSETLEAFAEVVRQFDIVAVQEIQDATGEAPRKLLAALNVGSAEEFAMLLSENSGREPSDKSFHERYAFYFRTDIISSASAPVLYDDTPSDFFNREPFVGHFRTGDFDFALVTVHTSPDFALDEIAALDNVMRWAASAVDPDVIVLGDYNASCSYASPDELDALALRQAPYRWLVPDDADTNVNEASVCAYDRIVVTPGAASAFTGRWGIDRPSPWFSDHWPVWTEFSAHVPR
jgi:endonuclease/exonuclease/phosphatase family metal-dependent hydrolase